MTLAKDLGGFNNIRMSLESAVAFAAATGRTFVIPPPFQIWNMNVGKPVEVIYVLKEENATEELTFSSQCTTRCSAERTRNVRVLLSNQSSS